MSTRATKVVETVTVTFIGPTAAEVARARRLLALTTVVVRSLMVGLVLAFLAFVANAARALYAPTSGDYAEVMQGNEVFGCALILTIATMCATMAILAAQATGWEATMAHAKATGAGSGPDA